MAYYYHYTITSQELYLLKSSLS